MPITTVGINYQSTPIHIREKLVFNDEQAPAILRELVNQPEVNEAVLLSTCNRTEIYTNINHPDILKKWIYDQSQLRNVDLTPFTYHHEGAEAVRHLMRVASGLDSLFLGEPQILGQIKKAYALAVKTGTAGHQFKQLFPAVFSTSKHIRYQTAIGQNPISIAYAVMQTAKRIFSNLSQCHVLFVGSGELTPLIAKHFYDNDIRQLTIANRSKEKALKLADSLQAQAINIGDIPEHLKHMDIIITATASQLPIFGKGMMERAIKEKKHRPIFIIDLAVPRDVEPEVSELEDVYLYNIDDLKSMIEQNLNDRKNAAEQAELIIDTEVQNYLRKLQVAHAGGIIKNYREQLHHKRDQVLQKALIQLRNGENPEKVIHDLSHQLTNKILHKPTVKIREAAYYGKTQWLEIFKDIFR